MSLAYLEDDIKLDTGMLVDPIRDNTVMRQIITPLTILDVKDQETTVETLTRDITVATGLDPFQARRASSTLKKEKFVVPVFQVEIQESIDNYGRIAKTKYPTTALMADVGITLTENEDAYFFTKTANTAIPGDFEGICASGSFRTPSSTLIANDYATGVSSLSSMMGDLIDGNGSTSVKGMKGQAFKSPLYLIVNPNVWNIANGTLNTNSDRTLLEAWDAMLNKASLGSRVIVSDFLGNTITVGSDGTISVAQTTSDAALVLASPKVLGVYASAFDIRQKPLDPVDGFYAKIVERWLPLVHNADGIIYEDGVTVA